jgi:hypothetical protein
MADNWIGDAWVVIRPDVSGFEASLEATMAGALTKVQALADAHPIHLAVEVDTAAAMAQLAALKATATITGGGGGDGGGGTPVAVAAGGGGGGGSSLLSMIGFGSAAGLFGLAGAFSAASFAGLGFEHVLTTAIGLAGSLAGAIGGGLLLAMGALGVAMVGMVSDMLVMRSALANVTAIATAQTAMNNAIAQYGAGSAQAITAINNYNFAVSQLPPTLRASTVALATMKNATVDMWQQATAAAQVAAQGIFKQVLTLAQTYIPLVAAAAKTNFDIISNAIKPLFAWLAGPQGTGIFKNLEAMFAKNLPTAIDAFTKAVELVLKTINFLAPMTGGLTKAIDDLLTKANSPAGFAKWEGIMQKLIDMFHTWWDFIKQVGITIYDLFSQSLGLGTAIVTTITGMLVKLDKWLTSSSGKNAIHTLFAVHLQEVLALLALLPTLLGAFGQLYLTIAPPLTMIVTGLADMVGWMVKIPAVGPLLAWAGAIWFIWTRLKLVAIATFIANLVTLSAGFIAVAFSEGLATAAAAAWSAALDANPIGVVLVAVIALGVGIALLVLHFKQVSDFLNGPLGTAISAIVAVFAPFIGIPMLIIGHWQVIFTFFHDLPGHIMDFLKALPGRILTFFEAVPGAMVTALTHGLPALLKWFIELPFQILQKIVQAETWLVQTGASIVAGMVKGFGDGFGAVKTWFKNLPGEIWKLVTGAPGWLLNTGINLIVGLEGGMTKKIGDIWTWFKGLPGDIIKHAPDLGTTLWNLGWSLIQGLQDGIAAKWSQITGWLAGIANDIANIFAIKLKTHSPSQVFYDIGTNIMDGLNNGLKAGAGGVMATMGGLAGALGGGLTVQGNLGFSGGGAAVLGLGSATTVNQYNTPTIHMHGANLSAADMAQELAWLAKTR